MTPKPTTDAEKQRIDRELDEALEETFPASDPIEPPEPEQKPSSPQRRNP